jgi:hypothetical protein
MSEKPWWYIDHFHDEPSELDGLPVYIKRALQNDGIRTAQQVRDYSPEQILRTIGLGRGALKTICAWLREKDKET